MPSNPLTRLTLYELVWSKPISQLRLSEIGDRTYEGQRHRASGLNLATAAIILWNTVYLDRAVMALRQSGYAIDDALCRTLHLSIGITST